MATFDNGENRELLAEILADSRHARDFEIEQAVMARSTVDQVNSWRGILQQETSRFGRQMLELYNNPKLAKRPRWLGGAGGTDFIPIDPRVRPNDVPVAINGFPLVTPPILATDPAFYGDQALQSHYRICYAGRKTYKKGRYEHSLRIVELIQDAATGWVEMGDATHIRTFDDDTEIRRDSLGGEKFDRYRAEKYGEAIDDFIKNNPRLAGMIPAYDDDNIQRADYLHRQFGSLAYGPPGTSRITTELLPKLDIAVGWEFPDELFISPVGILRYASDRMGAKESI